MTSRDLGEDEPEIPEEVEFFEGDLPPMCRPVSSCTLEALENEGIIAMLVPVGMPRALSHPQLVVQ